MSMSFSQNGLAAAYDKLQHVNVAPGVLLLVGCFGLSTLMNTSD